MSYLSDVANGEEADESCDIEHAIYFRHNGILWNIEEFILTDAFPGWSAVYAGSAFHGFVIDVIEDGDAIKFGIVYN